MPTARWADDTCGPRWFTGVMVVIALAAVSLVRIEDEVLPIRDNHSCFPLEGSPRRALFKLISFAEASVATIIIMPTRGAATLCDTQAFSAPQEYNIDPSATAGSDVYITACSYSSVVAPTLSLTGQATGGAHIHVVDTKVRGTFSINLVIDAGSFMTVTNLQRITSQPLPSVEMLGTILFGSQVMFKNSDVGAVTSSLSVTQCSSLQMLSVSMTQLTFTNASVFAESASFIMRGGRVVTVANAGQSHAVLVAGKMVDATFEISGATLTGDLKSAVVFDSSAITDLPAQGTSNVINITSNVLSVRATTVAGSPSVLKFVRPLIASQPASYLRGQTLLTIAANTFTVPSTVSIPLISCYSAGALVVHDGANQGSGGTLEFIMGGPSPSVSVLGAQLILRQYTALVSIAVEHQVPVVDPSLLVEGCTMQQLSVTGSQPSSGYNIMFVNKTGLVTSVTSSLTIGGHAISRGSVVVEGLTSMSSLTLNFVKVSGTTIEVKDVIVSGMAVDFPLLSASTLMIRGATFKSGGFKMSGDISGGSLLHVIENNIVSSLSDAVTIEGSVSGDSYVSIVSNTLKARALSTYYGIRWSGDVTAGRILVTKNTNTGGFYASGAFYGSTTELSVTANAFSPATASSAYIFYMEKWGNEARFHHPNSNSYTGNRPFEFNCVRRVGSPLKTFVYLSLSHTTASPTLISAFTFTSMPATSLVDYQSSVIDLTDVTIATASVDLSYTNAMYARIDGATITTLVPTIDNVQNTWFFVRSTKVEEGFTVSGGSMRSGSAIVLDALSTNANKKISITLSSWCTSTSTCLIALWNIVMKSNTNVKTVYFGGSIGDYTHIDIYKCNFQTTEPYTHVIEFGVGTPTGRSTVSLVENILICDDTLPGNTADNAYSLYVRSSPMTGGWEMFGNEFDGDGILATWTGSMAYMNTFSNRIEEGVYEGGGNYDTIGRYSCGTCGLFSNNGCISPGVAVSCSSTTKVSRCPMTSSFTVAPYDVSANAATFSSCVNLPLINAKVTSSVPMSSFVFNVGTYSLFYVGLTTTNTFALRNAITTYTCRARLNRLNSDKVLIRHPTRSAAVMFNSTGSCTASGSFSFHSVTFDRVFTSTDDRGASKLCKTVTVPATFSPGLSASVQLPPSATNTPSASLNATKTSSLTRSETVSSSATKAFTNSSSVDPTPTSTATATSRQSNSSRVSPSLSIQVSATEGSATFSASNSSSSSATLSPSLSLSLNETTTVSPSATHNATQSESMPPTQSASNTTNTSTSLSASQSASLEISASPSQSLLETNSLSFTGNDTTSASINGTATNSRLETDSMPPRKTRTATASQSPLQTNSPSFTGNNTVSASVNGTATSSRSETNSITPLETGTASASMTGNESKSLLKTKSVTSSGDVFATESVKNTPSESREKTNSVSSSENVTASTSKNATSSRSSSDTNSVTLLKTATASASQSPLQTNSVSLTENVTASASVNATTSKPSSETNSMTPPLTVTASISMNSTESKSPPGTHSVTPSDTITRSASMNGTESNSLMQTNSVTSSNNGTVSLSLHLTGSQSPLQTNSVSLTGNVTASASVNATTSKPSSETNSMTPLLTVTASISMNSTESKSPPGTHSVTTLKTRTASVSTSTTASESLSEVASISFLSSPSDTVPFTPSLNELFSQSLNRTSTADFSASPTQSVDPAVSLTALLTASQTSTPTQARATSPTVAHVADAQKGQLSGLHLVKGIADSIVMIALFDTQSVAVMSQQACAIPQQQRRFAHWLLLTPVAFWGGEDGSIIGSLVVIIGVGALTVVAALAVAYRSGRSPPNDCSGTNTMGARDAGSDAHDGGVDNAATHNQEENGGGFAVRRIGAAFVRCRAGLWFILFLALFPGCSFASVRAATDPSADVLVTAIGFVGCAVMGLIPLFVVPLLTKFAARRHWLPMPVEESQNEKKASAGGVGDGQRRAGGGWLDRAKAYLIDERNCRVSGTVVAQITSPLVAWRPRSVLWCLLPFASGLVNAALFGPVGHSFDATVPLCEVLLSTSAVTHFLLAALVATARPHTTRLQNILLAVSFTATAAGMAVAAAGVALIDSTEEDSNEGGGFDPDLVATLVLALFCLQTVLSVLKISIETWLVVSDPLPPLPSSTTADHATALPCHTVAGDSSSSGEECVIFFSEKSNGGGVASALSSPSGVDSISSKDGKEDDDDWRSINGGGIAFRRSQVYASILIDDEDDEDEDKQSRGSNHRPHQFNTTPPERARDHDDVVVDDVSSPFDDAVFAADHQRGVMGSVSSHLKTTATTTTSDGSVASVSAPAAAAGANCDTPTTAEEESLTAVIDFSDLCASSDDEKDDDDNDDDDDDALSNEKTHQERRSDAGSSSRCPPADDAVEMSHNYNNAQSHGRRGGVLAAATNDLDRAYAAQTVPKPLSSDEDDYAAGATLHRGDQTRQQRVRGVVHSVNLRSSFDDDDEDDDYYDGNDDASSSASSENGRIEDDHFGTSAYEEDLMY